MAKTKIVSIEEIRRNTIYSLCPSDYIPPIKRLEDELAMAERSLERAEARVIRARRALAAARARE